MTAPYPTIDVRPARPKDALKNFLLMLYDPAFALLRHCFPILKLGSLVVVSRNDDVREVMRRGVDFRVTYAEHLKIVMGDSLFLLGQDGEDFSRDVAAIKLVLLDGDIPDLAAKSAARCAALVAASNGSIEVVDLIRGAAQDVFCSYLGVTCPPGEDLQVIAMRIIEFVLADIPEDAGLKTEAARLSKALRDHIDRLIVDRKADAVLDESDVLGRCVARQRADDSWFTDGRIRALLVGLVSTALPQPPMAVGQILEQLLRRPAELAAAQALARADDPQLSGYVFEALRFAPLVPIVARKAHSDQVVAAGTPRKATIKSGSRVIAGLRSGMKDPRRVSEPDVFDPTRLWGGYMLFGDGPHTCLAEQISRALIPALLTEILKQHHLKRAPGNLGLLVMRGFFPDRLWVTF